MESNLQAVFLTSGAAVGAPATGTAWVTSMETGKPVEGASVQLFRQTLKVGLNRQYATVVSYFVECESLHKLNVHTTESELHIFLHCTELGIGQGICFSWSTQSRASTMKSVWDIH